MIPKKPILVWHGSHQNEETNVTWTRGMQAERGGFMKCHEQTLH